MNCPGGSRGGGGVWGSKFQKCEKFHELPRKSIQTVSSNNNPDLNLIPILHHSESIYESFIPTLTHFQ